MPLVIKKVSFKINLAIFKAEIEMEATDTKKRKARRRKKEQKKLP